MTPGRGKVVAASVVAALLAGGCERYETLAVLPEGAMRTQYLADFERSGDAERLVGHGGYLVVFNPGPRRVPLDVTIFFEDREPERFTLEARPGATLALEIGEWPVVPQGRFALAIDSAEPVIAQATLAWSNTGGDLRLGAATRAGQAREAATSYMAIPRLADRWYLADGVVLDDPRGMWARESEWTLVLNPGDEPAAVTLATFYRWFTRHAAVEVPARRVRAVKMDDLVVPNRHYGLRVTSDRPVAVQSRRVVYWNDSPDVMTLWSVPCVALPSLTDADEHEPIDSPAPAVSAP